MDAQEVKQAQERLRDGANVPTTLTGYLQAVSDIWMLSDKHDCAVCEMHDDGHCAMLHDRSVPEGDCRALLMMHGWKQPTEG